MHDISSLLSRFNASAVNCLAAAHGSLNLLATSTTSRLFITWSIKENCKKRSNVVPNFQSDIGHLGKFRRKKKAIPSKDRHLQGQVAQRCDRCFQLLYQALISEVILDSCLQKLWRQPTDHILGGHLLKFRASDTVGCKQNI